MPIMMRAKGKATKIASDIKGPLLGEKKKSKKKDKKKKATQVFFEESRVV